MMKFRAWRPGWEVAELDAKRALQLDPANAKAQTSLALFMLFLGHVFVISGLDRMVDP